MTKYHFIILGAAVAANIAGLFVSLTSIGRSNIDKQVLTEELRQARKDLGLSELRARQALDELHSLKSGRPRAIDILPDNPGPVEPLVEQKP